MELAIHLADLTLPGGATALGPTHPAGWTARAGETLLPRLAEL